MIKEQFHSKIEKRNQFALTVAESMVERAATNSIPNENNPWNHSSMNIPVDTVRTWTVLVLSTMIAIVLAASSVAKVSTAEISVSHLDRHQRSLGKWNFDGSPSIDSSLDHCLPCDAHRFHWHHLNWIPCTNRSRIHRHRRHRPNIRPFDHNRLFRATESSIVACHWSSLRWIVTMTTHFVVHLRRTQKSNFSNWNGTKSIKLPQNISMQPRTFHLKRIMNSFDGFAAFPLTRERELFLSFDFDFFTSPRNLNLCGRSRTTSFFFWRLFYCRGFSLYLFYFDSFLKSSHCLFNEFYLRTVSELIRFFHHRWIYFVLFFSSALLLYALTWMNSKYFIFFFFCFAVFFFLYFCVFHFVRRGRRRSQVYFYDRKFTALSILSHFHSSLWFTLASPQSSLKM